MQIVISDYMVGYLTTTGNLLYFCIYKALLKSDAVPSVKLFSQCVHETC